MGYEAKKYFYCYNKTFALYLKKCGFDYITMAKNRYDDRIFTLWEKTTEFEKALVDYTN